eukprot:6507118-Prymnesium_polylepis.1
MTSFADCVPGDTSLERVRVRGLMPECRCVTRRQVSRGLARYAGKHACRRDRSCRPGGGRSRCRT